MTSQASDHRPTATALVKIRLAQTDPLPYWEITTTGTNGADIIENDIVSGGFPTVTLSGGQDFTNNRCGSFVKQ